MKHKKEKQVSHNKEHNKEALLHAVFAPFAKEVAKERLSEALSKGKLLVPETTYIKQQEEAVIASIDHEITEMQKTFALAADLLKKHIDTLPIHQKETIQNEMGHAFSGIKERFEASPNHDPMQSLQRTLGLSNETLLWIYKVGHHYFEEKHYTEAQSVFFLLTILNHLVSDYWLALGMAQENLHQDEAAIYSLSMASDLNPESPMPCYHLASLYHKTHRISESKAECEKLAHIASKHKDKQWHKAVETLQSKIRSSKKAS